MSNRSLWIGIMIGCISTALLMFAVSVIGAQATRGIDRANAATTDNNPSVTTLGTAFTYQGLLKQNGVPVSATCNMTFTLHDAASLGGVVGTPYNNVSVSVDHGLFTKVLDFGASAFTGNARWLAIDVYCNGDAASLPRQALTASPYALYALNDWSLTGNSNIVDTNFVGTTDFNPLALRTNNIERMRIMGTGNVGIGLVNPFSSLAVSGTIESTAGGFKFPDSTTQSTAASKIVAFRSFNTSGNLTTTVVTLNSPFGSNMTVTVSTPALYLLEFGGTYYLSACNSGTGMDLLLYKDNGSIGDLHTAVIDQDLSFTCNYAQSTFNQPVENFLAAGTHVFQLRASSSLTATAGGNTAQINASWLKITQE